MHVRVSTNVLGLDIASLRLPFLSLLCLKLVYTPPGTYLAQLSITIPLESILYSSFDDARTRPSPARGIPYWCFFWSFRRSSTALWLVMVFTYISDWIALLVSIICTVKKFSCLHALIKVISVINFSWSSHCEMLYSSCPLLCKITNLSGV